MAYGRPSRRARGSGSGGPPAWFIFLVGVAIVFGVYYVWLGVQNFLRTGGRGVLEVTQQAQVVSTATARVRPTADLLVLPTQTPVLTCQDFVVSVPNAIVREGPFPNAAIVTSFSQNQTVCALGRTAPDSEWYLIDLNPRTRRIEAAYMHETVIRAVNPTPTPSRTPTFEPTLTPSTTPTETTTPTPRPTATLDPAVTDTPEPTPTPTPSPTRSRQSA